MRWSITIPQFATDGAFDPQAFRSYLARADELGFDSAWTLEGILSEASLLSPLETMTYAAACTERLRLGCVVFVLPLHQPVHLAKAIASLDQLSRGRIEVGVGTGGKARPFAAFQTEPDSFVARFNESVQLMKTLWTEPSVTFDGRFWQLRGEVMEPKPFQKPYPPLWFGGSAPAALRRAVRNADGFFGAGSTTTQAFAEQVSVVRAELSEQRGATDRFKIAKRVYIAVDDDAERARQGIVDVFLKIYGEFGRSLEPVAVYGPPADCVAGLRAVADAGAERILLNPLFDQREQMERLAADVMPLVA